MAFKKLIILAGLALSISAHSAIIFTSDSVIDDASNLEWLSLNETSFISYDSILTMLGNGDFTGYRVATHIELVDFVTNNGLISGSQSGNSLYEHWANIDPTPFNNSPFDIIMSEPNSSSPELVTGVLFFNSIFSSSSASYLTSTAYADSAVALVKATVTEVPIPSTVWLLFFGIAGLLINIRDKGKSVIEPIDMRQSAL